MRLKEINPEVFVADEPLVKISQREIGFLKERIKTAPRGRVRLCAHAENADPLHEMLIVLSRQTYIRPHKHFRKSESFHVIEGEARIVLFDESGGIDDVVELGEVRSGRKFFYRLSAPRYHTVLIGSDLLIIHETTNGPFRPADAEFAPWAPAENDPLKCQSFMARCAEQAQKFMAGRANNENT